MRRRRAAGARRHRSGDVQHRSRPSRRAAITPRTKAILPVHLFGLSADLDADHAIAASIAGLPIDRGRGAGDRRDLPDRARLGGIGAFGCFSFFPSKNLGAFGDAGLVTTDDDGLATRARLLRTHGMEPKYLPPSWSARNFRMDALQAAVRRGVTTQIFIGLLLGIVVGYLWPDSASPVKPLADAFLRMIKMIIAPLALRDARRRHRRHRRSQGDGAASASRRSSTSRSATTIALFLGLALVNIFQPGAGLAMPIGADTSAAAAMAQNQQHAWDIFLHLFPTSVVDAMARGDILQLVVFSTFFGIALAAIGPKGQPVLDVLDSTAQVMFKFTGYVMAFAPIGVFAAIAATVGGKGLAILFTLGKLVALMYLGLDRLRPHRRRRRLVSDPRAVLHVPQSDPRAVPDRVHDRELRGRAAASRSRSWSASASRRTSSASCCRPATASTSTARRSTCRSPASSSRSSPASR